MPLMGETGTQQRFRSKRNVTGSTTVQASDDVILVNAASGPVTVTLALASSRTMDITVKKVDSSNNAVTITPTNPDTIDGKANYVLTSATMPSVTLTPSTGGYFVL